MPKVTDRHGRPTQGQMPGLVEAIVIDNKDPEQLGRVKLKYPTLPDSTESTWARLSMPMAGQERGFMTIPEVDDEVLVSFVHGDIQNAIVMGSLFNGVDTPPYANEDGSNNLRVFQSRSGHRLTFDDTAGDERIELILNNEELRFIFDAKEKTLSIYSGKDIIIEAKETISFKCKDFIVEATNNISMEAKQTVNVTAGQSMTIDGGQNLVMKAGTINLN